MELKTYFAQDRTGNLIPSASVSIFLTGTTTLASGLTNVSGTALTNPFTADADGKIQFRAPDGIYDMQVSLGSTTGVKVTFQCVDVEQQLSDANSAADRAELAAHQAEDAAAQIGQPSFSAESQSAMLALDAKVGALAVRTDTNQTYRLITLPASTLTNWQLIKYDASDVVHGSSTIGDEVDALKSYPATGTEVSITPQDRARRELWSSDFSSATNDNGERIHKAIASLQADDADLNTQGGKVNLPRGVLPVSTEINFDKWNPGTDQIDSIEIVGQGVGTTELRSNNLAAGSCVIKATQSTSNDKAIQYCKLADFGTRGGIRGVSVDLVNRATLDRVKAAAASQDGFYFGNFFLADIRNIHGIGNGASGARFDYANTPWSKQKTSTVVNSGYMQNNGNHGWEWGFMNYSAAFACAADSNVNHGHYIRNCDGFVMSGCGAESNGRSAFCAESSATYGENNNVVIEGAFSHHNNKSNNGWANLLHVKASDGVRNHVTVRNSRSNPDTGNTTQCVIADGDGAVVTIDNCTLPNGWIAINGGYIEWVHHPITVKNQTFTAANAKAIAKLKSTQGHSVSYAGEITVVARNSDPSSTDARSATYKLLINKSSVGPARTVQVVSSAGETTGASTGSPSFTWSIDASEQLVATPVGSTAASFWFELTTSGQVVAQNL